MNYSNDKNINIKTEKEKFEDIVDDSLLRNLGWYLVSANTEYKVKAKWFYYSNVVKFVLKRKINTD